MNLSSVLAIAGIALVIAALVPGITTPHFSVPDTKRGMRIILGIVGAALMATGVLYGAIVENGDKNEAPAAKAAGVDGDSSPMAVSPRGPKPRCPGPAKALPPGDAVDITNLKDGDPVDFEATDVWGTVTLAPGHQLWFFAWGPATQQMYILGGGRPDVDNGHWTFSHLALGDGSGDDAGKYFCITAMVVDAPENDFLEGLVSSRKDTGWALEPNEIPQQGLASTRIVFLRRSAR